MSVTNSSQSKGALVRARTYELTTMSIPEPRLPLELILDIIDLLEPPQDSKTLEVLSRVCKILLPVSRRRLFTSLRLRAKDFARVSSEWVEWHGFLKPFHPDLSVVTHLYLQGQPRMSTITSALLKPVLSHLPSLRHLRLRGWDVSHFGFDAPLLPNVDLDTLELVHLRCVRGPQGLLDVLRSLGSARAISVEKVEVPYEGLDGLLSTCLEPALAATPASLTLRSSTPCTRLLLDLLSTTPAALSIRTLEVGLINIATVLPSIAHFLKNAQNLETLVLDLQSDLPLDAYGTALLMDAAAAAVTEYLAPAFANTESLHRFALRLPGAWKQHTSFWAMCTALLGALPIGIRVLDVHVQGDSLFFDDGEFAAALARLGALERVRIVVGRAFSADAYRERVARQLPGVAARGDLEVVVED